MKIHHHQKRSFMQIIISYFNVMNLLCERIYFILNDAHIEKKLHAIILHPWKIISDNKGLRYDLFLVNLAMFCDV
jgi:hypothetical protein